MGDNDQSFFLLLLFFFAGNGYFELDLSYRNVAFSFRPDSRKSVRRKGRKKGKKKERPGKLTD